MEKEYCCRFELPDGFYTAEWIKGEALSINEARVWARNQLKRNKNYKKVASVYEVKKHES